MTIKKVKNALNRVERRVDDFYDIRFKESYERAIEEIQDFNHSVGIMLWDEMEGITKCWKAKEDTHAD